MKKIKSITVEDKEYEVGFLELLVEEMFMYSREVLGVKSHVEVDVTKTREGISIEGIDACDEDDAPVGIDVFIRWDSDGGREILRKYEELYEAN